jgi:CheY-like chemotaxis protein
MLLEELGMTADIARDGIEAVERFAAAPTDIVLMDVQMPRLDGLDATRRIRATAAGARVPIIGVSANVFTEDRAACFAAGMNDFVGKPVLPEVLEQALARWLAPGIRPPGDAP